MGIAQQLAHQCQDNGLVKYWLKIVQDLWMSLLNKWNTGDTVRKPKQTLLGLLKLEIIW